MTENIKYINADELYINLDTMKNPDTEFATDDYIDGFSDGISAVIKELEIMPATDVAKVVRCKDCVLHGHCSTEDVFLFSRLKSENAFCCVGKRKEN